MQDTSAFRKFIKAYRKSELIFDENSPGNEMYVIHSGKVRLSTRKMGKEIILATLGPGEFFGEMALVDSSPRTATAIAVEDNTRLVTLDQDKFLYLVGQQPAFALTIMHELCRRIRERWSLYDTLLKEKTEPSGKSVKRKPK
jgi:CRP/FNR family cyclic AMP-dependent transcriptional regulator